MWKTVQVVCTFNLLRNAGTKHKAAQNCYFKHISHTGLAQGQCVVKYFLFYYYTALNAIFEFWSVPSNVLWGLDMFCELFGFKQIRQMSAKFPVNVNGNDFIDVSLDHITDKKKLYMKQPFNKMRKLVDCSCEWMHVEVKTCMVDLKDGWLKVQIIYSHSLRPFLYMD